MNLRRLDFSSPACRTFRGVAFALGVFFHSIGSLEAQTLEMPQWQFLAIAGNEGLSYDQANVFAAGNFRAIYVKTNIESGSGGHSTLQKMLIQCDGRLLRVDESTTYPQLNLKGNSQGKQVYKRKFSRTVPNSVGEAIVDAACKASYLKPLDQESAAALQGIQPSVATPDGRSSFTPNLTLPEVRSGDPVWEVKKIEWGANSPERVYLQFFSDGRVSVIVGGSHSWMQIVGKGLIRDGNSQIFIDESGKRLLTNSRIYSGVNVISPPRPDFKSMTYGERINFPRPLSRVQSEIEAKGACSSLGERFGSLSNRDWADERAKGEAMVWSLCLQESEAFNDEFWGNHRRWRSNVWDREDISTLQSLLQRCMVDYRVRWKIVKSPDGRNLRKCSGVFVTR